MIRTDGILIKTISALKKVFKQKQTAWALEKIDDPIYKLQLMQLHKQTTPTTNPCRQTVLYGSNIKAYRIDLVVLRPSGFDRSAGTSYPLANID